MALPPKKIKTNININTVPTGLARREELLSYITKDGTYLPKSILHADLDRGMLDFVKNDLKCVVEGAIVPSIDVIITLQNWAQFAQTWNFQDLKYPLIYP